MTTVQILTLLLLCVPLASACTEENAPAVADAAGDTPDGRAPSVDGGAPADAGSLADGDSPADGGVATSSVPAVVFGPCDLSNAWPEGWPNPRPGLECAEVSVPLDHASPAGAQISLRVARHAATEEPGVRAAFQLAGGPGGSSVAQSALIPRLLPGVRLTYDLVYVDQRGTGGSGYLDCGGLDPETSAEWSACARAHAALDQDHYRTVDGAHDLEWVRQRLGYATIAIRGGSYGTRLALEYLRQHDGPHLESAVLDGLVPPDGHFFETFIVNFDRGVQRIVSDCEGSVACRGVAPDLGSDLRARRAALRAQPRPIRVGGTAYQEDEQTYLLFLYTGLLDSYFRFRIPRAIHTSVGGDNTLWNGLLSEMTGASVTDDRSLAADPARPPLRARPRAVRGQSYVSPGLYALISCAEEIPNSPDRNALRALAAAQEWGDDHILELHSGCDAWRVTRLEPALLAPVRSNAKVLLMNGDLDLNTFPEEGARVGATLPNSRNLIVPFATHSTMLDPCAAQIMTDFIISRGDSAALDISCLHRIPEPTW